jgi:hypothetical protein
MSAITDKAINWSNIGLCPYTGDGITAHRKLYRYSSTLGDVYYVATIQDNTSTTYTDTNLEATILLNDPISTTGYDVPPDNMVDVCHYLYRVFGIVGNELYYSEPYMPFSFIVATSLAVSRPGEDLVSCLQWGDQLYLGWPQTWRRLQGSDSDTWKIKNTFSEQGPVNTHTTKKSRFGIIFQWWDGIYIFDGTVSRNITRKDMGTSLFENIPYPKSAFAEFDGQKYWFNYGSTTTTLDTCLIIDFKDYPNLKFYNYDSGFIPTAYEYHFPSGIAYFGKSDGYQYKNTGSETIATYLQTGDRSLGSLLRLKNLRRLYYDINTGGADVTVTIYADGSACTPTYTLNKSSRTRDFITLANPQGYRFSIRLACAASTSLTLYEPWGLGYTPFGEEP